MAPEFLTVTKFNKVPPAQRKKNQPNERMNLIILELNNYTTAEKKGNKKSVILSSNTYSPSAKKHVIIARVLV